MSETTIDSVPVVETVVANEVKETEIDEAVAIMTEAENSGTLYGDKLKQIADEHNERTVRTQAAQIFANVLKHAAKVGSYKYEMTTDEPMSADLIKYLGTQGLTIAKETTSYGFLFSGTKYTYVINYGPQPEPVVVTKPAETVVEPETAVETEVVVEQDSELETN